MTMTDERLAELDAVMAKATLGEWQSQGSHFYGPDEGKGGALIGQCLYPSGPKTDDLTAIVALHNAYPDLRAHIDAQSATIARQDEALNIAHTAFADCDQSNPMQVEAIAIVRATLTGAA